MASRVNTRFVVLLIVGVVALLGMLVLAWSVVIKSASDLAAKGDSFMQQGDFKQAEFVYSKAVNKDSTNVEYLDKWMDSLEKLIPETETEYRDRYSGDYAGAMRKIATVLRDDVDAHARALENTYRRLDLEYNRSLADRLIEDTTSVLAYFDTGADTSNDWETLKRYRGIPITEIARRNGVLDDNQILLGIDDLERAIAANPDDTESRIKLMTLRGLKVDRETPDGEFAPRIAAMQQNLQENNDYLREHPDDMLMSLQRIWIQMSIDINSVNQTKLESAERIKQFEEVTAGYVPELDQITEQLAGPALDQLNRLSYGLLLNIERYIARSDRSRRARSLLEKLIEKDPTNAQFLFQAASLARSANDTSEAMDLFSKIADLESKPLSLEGLMQFTYQRNAILQQAEIKIEEAQSIALTGSESMKETAIAEARGYRDAYAAEVGEDDLDLMLIDGKLASVEDRLDEALRLFKQYNDQTQRNRPEGLWNEGLVASQLGQYGLARDALELMINLASGELQIKGLITLAQINEELQNYETAAQYYKDVLTVAPTLQVAIDGLSNVNKMINPELNEDPIIADIMFARKMRLGTDDEPGDYAGAVQFLRESVIENNYESRVAMELATLLLDREDVDGAKLVITKSIEQNPDDGNLTRMLDAMSSDDTSMILVQMVRASARPELEKLLYIANIAATRNMNDLLSETVIELNQLAPDDPNVIEMTFSDSIRREDFATAQQITQRPGLKPLQALTLRARLAATQNQPDTAIDLLQQAVASGSADVSTYQMLAVMQRETGRINEAIASFERALAIRPDNVDAIREYIYTLAISGQYEQALNSARRLQRYASTDSTFMNIWLNLEAQFGGTQGRDFATRQRERMLELNPTAMDNTFQLARLYIQSRDWDAARLLIDQMRSTSDNIALVELDATWHANQGIIDNQNGLLLANEVFSNYIDSLPEPVGAEPYIVNSNFMLARGRPDLALLAATEAVKRQSPETMTGSILLGDLNMRINNYSQAVTAFRQVIDAGADDENFTVRARLMESLLRLERYDEAQKIYAELPQAKQNAMLTMLQASDIAEGLGDAARARQLLDQAVASYPNESLVYIKRAESMIGDETLLNDLLSDIERALEIDSSSWQAYRVRTAAYFAVDRLEDAINDLKTSVRLNANLDQAINSLLNELLLQTNRAGEAADVARDVIAQRPDDANLISRIGGFFAARKQWEYAAEFFGRAWDKRRSGGDGAAYIDALVRLQPPDATKANEVINALAGDVGNINENSGLLAAQALVLQARGRDDFAQQQITKAFDLSVNNDNELRNWANNLSRYYEGRPASEHITYLETLKRRNSNTDIGNWLDYFIAIRLATEESIPQRMFDILARLKAEDVTDPIALRAFRLHGTTMFNQKAYEQAASIWEAGLQRFPNDWEMNNNLAYVLSSRLGRPLDALQYGERVIAENVSQSEAYETMAGIYLALGKLDEAQQMIDTGSGFVKTIPARVEMDITQGRLELARGNIQEARSKISDARSVLRSASESLPSLQTRIDEFEQEVDAEAN